MRADDAGRRVDDARGHVADAHLGQTRPVDWKVGAFDGDAAAFDRPAGERR